MTVIDEVPETYQHMFMAVGKAYFEELFDYNIYEDIENFNKDVLIIHGDSDDIVPPFLFRKGGRSLPFGKLGSYPRCGTWILR